MGTSTVSIARSILVVSMVDVVCVIGFVVVVMVAVIAVVLVVAEILIAGIISTICTLISAALTIRSFCIRHFWQVSDFGSVCSNR